MKKQPSRRVLEVLLMEQTLNNAVSEMGVSRADNRLQKAINYFRDGIGEKPDPCKFFQAWAISPVLIAERLRRLGFETDAYEVAIIVEHGIRNKMDYYHLSLAMMEMKNDIIKTISG